MTAGAQQSPFPTYRRDRSAVIDAAIARPLAWLRLSPNHVTCLGVLSLAGVIHHCLRGEYRAATAYIALCAFCDVADGSLARYTGRCSRFGQLLDRTADKIVDTTLFGLFTALALIPLPLGLFVIGILLISTLVSANIEAIYQARVSDALSMRALRMSVIVLLTPLELFVPLAVIVAIFSGVSLIGRLRVAWRLNSA